MRVVFRGGVMWDLWLLASRDFNCFEVNFRERWIRHGRKRVFVPSSIIRFLTLFTFSVKSRLKLMSILGYSVEQNSIRFRWFYGLRIRRQILVCWLRLEIRFACCSSSTYYRSPYGLHILNFSKRIEYNWGYRWIFHTRPILLKSDHLASHWIFLLKRRDFRA